MGGLSDAGDKESLPSSPLLLGALEVTEDGLLVLDEEGEPIYYNRRLTELLSIAPELLEERNALGAAGSAQDQFHDPDRFIQAVEESLEDPTATTHDEFRLRNGRVVQRFSRPSGWRTNSRDGS